MVFLLLDSVLFPRPLTFFIVVGGNGGRGKLKMVSASTSSTNEPGKDIILVHTVRLKPTINAQISGRMVSNGISDVATASVYSEKTRLKKLMMMMKMIIMIIIIIIMNKSQETTVLRGRQKLTSAMKLRPEK